MKLTLKVIRAMHDMTQDEAAEKAGISKSTWYMAENGKGTPNWDTMQKISEAFDVPIGDIELKKSMK